MRVSLPSILSVEYNFIMRKRNKSQNGDTSQASTTMHRTNQSFCANTRPNTTHSSPPKIDLFMNDSSQPEVIQPTYSSNPKYSYYHSKYEQPSTPWKQSAGTWTRSTISTSFSKEKRFIVPKPACLYKLQLSRDNSLSKRSTSQGFGRKSEFYDHIVKRTKDLMEREDFYSEERDPDDPTFINKGRCQKCDTKPRPQTSDTKSKRGRTFGCSWTEYKKNGIIGHDFQVVNEYPGVGSYKPDSPLNKKMRAFTIYQRLTPFNDVFDHQIPALTLYTPVTQKRGKHTEPTATRSQRLDLAKPLNDNPSSQHYNIKRFLD